MIVRPAAVEAGVPNASNAVNSVTLKVIGSIALSAATIALMASTVVASSIAVRAFAISLVTSAKSSPLSSTASNALIASLALAYASATAGAPL